MRLTNRMHYSCDGSFTRGAEKKWYVDIRCINIRVYQRKVEKQQNITKHIYSNRN